VIEPYVSTPMIGLMPGIDIDFEVIRGDQVDDDVAYFSRPRIDRDRAARRSSRL
jgi:hypothetical protein